MRTITLAATACATVALVMFGVTWWAVLSDPEPLKFAWEKAPEIVAANMFGVGAVYYLWAEHGIKLKKLLERVKSRKDRF